MKKIGILAVAMLAWPSLTWGQSSPLIIDRNRADRSVPTPVPRPAEPLRQVAPQTGTIAIMPFVLRQVRVEGTSIPPTLIADATKPFIGQTIDQAGISRIADALSAAYARSDVALYTVIAPVQDFSGGVLTLTVQEGYIERADLHGDVDGDRALLDAYVAHMTAERPLTLRTMQRYISLIRDLPGLTPDIQLLRGGAPGATVLSIGMEQKKLLIGIGVNNSGSSLLGRTQIQLDATFINLFREGEQTRFTFAAPTDVERFQYYAFSQSEPLGSDGTLAQLSLGLLRTKPKGLGTEGEADTVQLLVSHPLIRSYDENLYLTGGVDGLNSDNALLGQSLATERVRTMRIAGAYTLNDPMSALGLSGTISQGIDGLGAREPSPLFAASDFTKLNLQAGYNLQLGTSFIARLRAAGQYGADRLPTSELSPLGGADFGRAFATASVTGDSSLAGSAEFAFVPHELGIPMLQGSELYVFADRETAWYRARVFPGQTYDLASGGFGTRLSLGQKAVLQIEAANVFDAPSVLASSGTWRINVGLHASY